MASVRKFVSVVAFVATTAVPGFAFATPESDLASAENSYAALDYPAASAKADEVLSLRGLNHDMLVRATRVAALSHAALGHADKAKEYFILLLGYDPEFKVDAKLGPRFAEPFAEARGYWQAQGRRPAMEVQAVMQYGQAGQIRITTVDPMNNIKRVAVGYRWAPARDYTNVTVEPGTRSIDVPANPSGAGRLDYWVRAMDAKDNAVFEEGSPEGPKTVMVSEPANRTAGTTEEKKSFFGSGLFLVATGVVLAGAAVGGYFLFRPTEYTPATTGRTAFGASCGNVRCE